MKPVISIVTIVYNAVHEIEPTLLSVINQDYPNIEYIVIDGGSKDGTIDIIRKYQNSISVYVSEPDHGIYDAMNKGICKATGDWLLFMNAGDSFASLDVISRVFTFPNDYEGMVAVYGNVNMVYDGWSVVTKPAHITLLKEKMPFSHQAIFVRTNFHMKHLFSKKYKIASDYEFFYNLYMSSYLFKYVDIVIANYDAIRGLSAKQCILARKENAIINGKIKDLSWNFEYIIFTLKVKIISILPNNLYRCIRKFKKNIRL